MSPSMNHWIRIRKLRRQGIRLRLQQTGEGGGSQAGSITEKEGEAAKQANSIKRTIKERERREEIRANLQEQNPSIRERKQEMRSIPLLRSLQKT